MSRNRHHPVRLAKGGKRLAPDKREGVGLIATAGMAAVVALISILCIAFGGVAVADEDVTGERVESQDLAVLMVPLVESWDLEAAAEPQRIEEALVAQGYFRNDVPLTYEEQDYLHTACEEAQIPYALALAMIQQETQFRNMVGDGGDSEGYMQVQRRWHEDRMERLGVEDLMEPFSNFRVGCDFMAELLAQYPMEDALTAYNSGHPGSGRYSRKVMESYEAWKEVVGDGISGLKG